MKGRIYTAGAFALALALSGLPAVVLAERNVDGELGAGVNAQTGVPALGVNASAGVSAQAGEEDVREQQKQNAEVSREQQKQQQETAREREKQQLEASSSFRIGGEDGEEISLDLEDEEDLATSSEDLNLKIEVRKHQLEQEAASTSPEHQVALEHANEVRLAVHGLLASRDLLGSNGIGQQVSDIAKAVDNSVASTTNAEAKIQARGFFTRLLFGGDTTSAEVIAQEAAQNQARIDSLTALLNQANVSADLKVTLEAQIAALKDAQARLQDLAQREKSAWGLFSWRF